MKQRVSTHIFNFQLYLEALKRLKVIAMATLILAVVVSALIPVTHWIERSEHAPLEDEMVIVDGDGYVFDEELSGMEPPDYVRERINLPLLCPAIYGVMLLSPFFLLALFRFLHKRRECDFFHAIPYTRTCTYISFLSASLTAVFGIIALSTAVAGILWAINPYAEIFAADFILQALVTMLASAMLSGIMMLAITLTGTTASSVVFFGFFSFFWRYILYLFEESWNYHIYPLHEHPYFKLSWFLPIGAFNALTEHRYYDAYADYWEFSNILYSLVITVALLILSGVIYKFRKSEMAGQTAPNKLLGHIFRCLFALPVALLIYLLGYTPTEFFIILVITLLVYYIYELVTAKKMKALPKATPWLLGVLAGVLIFGGIKLGLQWYLLYENIEEDEIKSITLADPAELYGYEMSYEMKYLAKCFGDTDDLTSDDPEAVKILAEQLEATQYGDRTNWSSTYLSDAHWVTVKIHLKGGRTITRRVVFGSNKLYFFKFNFTEGLEAQNESFKQSELLALRAEDIQTAYFHEENTRRSVKDPDDVLLQTYLEEYAALSLSDQNAHSRPYNIHTFSEYYGSINIIRKDTGAKTVFLITDKTPETRDLLIELARQQRADEDQ